MRAVIDLDDADTVDGGGVRVAFVALVRSLSHFTLGLGNTLHVFRIFFYFVVDHSFWEFNVRKMEIFKKVLLL